MRRIILIGAAALSMSLTSCATMGKVVADSGAQVVSDRVEIGANKALIMAELTYQGAVNVVNAGIATGYIKGPVATVVQDANKLCLEALDRGYRATSTIEKARAASDLLNYAATLRSLAAP